MRDFHEYARERAALLKDPDKKQLRFNEIVGAALVFYEESPEAGIAELVDACDKTSPLYVHKSPMHEVLRRQYQWMIADLPAPAKEDA